MATALVDTLPLLLEERVMRSSLSSLGSSRSYQSVGNRSVGNRSTASIRFSERSAASGLSFKCAQCTAMGIRICSQCSSNRFHISQSSGRPWLGSGVHFPSAEKRKLKVENEEESPEGLEMLRCLREGAYDSEGFRALVSANKKVANLCEKSFGWSPLLFAANRGDANLLSLLLDSRANVNIRCYQGNSALHLAARRGNLNAVTLLQSRGADIEAQNAQGWTPLMWSAIAGCPSIASFLLDANADPSVRDAGGRTACMWAARHGYTDILRNLLSLGADLSLRDEDGWSIKDHAKYYMKAQRSMGSAVISDNHDSAELYWSTTEGFLNLHRLLMQHGASEGPQAKDSLQGPLRAVEEAILRSEQLLDAARGNNWEAAEEALRAGACASTRGRSDLLSPLAWAAIHDAPASAFSLAAAMCDLEARDGLGWTALHHAVHANSAEMVSVLHYLGADFSAKSDAGDSVQHLAALSDAGEMLQLLGPATSDWNIRDGAGFTPLQVAVPRGCLSAVNALLALQADVNVTDERGQSLLSMAAAQGHTAVLQALFEPVEPLPLTWAEDDLNMALEKLPWVDSDVVDNDAQGRRGGSNASMCSGSNASMCSGSNASCTSSVSARNDKLGTKLAKKLHHRNKHGHGMHTIKEDDSEAGSKRSTPREERPKSAGSQKSAALTQLSSQSRAASVAKSSHSQVSAQSLAKSVHSQVSVQSLARSVHSQVSNQSLARSASHVSLRSRTGSLNSKFSRASGLSRSSAGGRSKANRLSSMPPTIYSMAVTAIGRSPVSLMNAAGKTSLGDQLPPPLALPTALYAADADGTTAIAVAVRTRQPDVVRLLLDMKAAPDTPDSKGNTALMLAASAGDPYIVESLLGAGAAVNALNAAGHQALDLAANADVREMLHAVIDRSAVEKQVSKSCSLPALAEPRSRPTSKVADSKPSGSRVRLDYLPSRAADIIDIEAQLRETLKRYRVSSPLTVNVALDPITMRDLGHAFLDYASAEQAGAAASRLLRLADDTMNVSIEPSFA